MLVCCFRNHMAMYRIYVKSFVFEIKIVSVPPNILPPNGLAAKNANAKLWPYTLFVIFVAIWPMRVTSRPSACKRAIALL